MAERMTEDAECVVLDDFWENSGSEGMVSDRFDSELEIEHQDSSESDTDGYGDVEPPLSSHSESSDIETDFSGSSGLDVPSEISPRYRTSCVSHVLTKRVVRRSGNRDSDRKSGWKVHDASPRQPVFTENPRITLPLDGNCSEYDCFEYFFDRDILKSIELETNRYASCTITRMKKWKKRKSRRPSLWQNWEPVRMHELYKFFAIILHMCVLWKPNLDDYWSTRPIIHSTFAYSSLSKDRFLSILAMLHLNSNRKYVSRKIQKSDPLHKIRPYFDAVVSKFREALVPNENLVVEEGIWPFREKTRFKIYMKNKPTKYGAQLHMLRDAKTGYAVNIAPYTKRGGAVMYLLDWLLQDYYGKGYTVFMDRFYTTPKVMDVLWKEGTFGVGTCLLSKLDMPKALKETKLKPGEAISRQRKHLMALKWRGKKEVVVLSTKHQPSFSELTIQSGQSRSGIKKMKPDALLDYNIHKKSLDRQDPLVPYYPFKRTSMKWWKKLFFQLFVRSVVNSYIVFRTVKSGANETFGSLESFIVAIAEHMSELSETELACATAASSSDDRLTGRHFPRKMPSNAKGKEFPRPCKVCLDYRNHLAGQWPKKTTLYYCQYCYVPLCVPECFEVYHTKENYVEEFE